MQSSLSTENGPFGAENHALASTPSRSRSLKTSCTPFSPHLNATSPAKKAGFRIDDKLVDWDGAAIPDTGKYNDLISRAKKGDKVEISIERKGRKRKLKVKLGST